jgi:hypothetical protein
VSTTPFEPSGARAGTEAALAGRRGRAVP